MALAQATMTPLYDTRSASDVLLQLGKRLELKGLPSGNLMSISRKRVVARAGEIGRCRPR